MHTFQFCRYLRGAPAEPKDLPIPQKVRCFCITKIRLKGDIFEEKGISEKFC